VPTQLYGDSTYGNGTFGGDAPDDAYGALTYGSGTYGNPSVSVVVVVSGVQAIGLVGYVNVWGLVPNTQNPNWTDVVDTQISGWTPVPTVQGPNWTQVIN
jgi:hypothetical protein